MKKDLNWLKNKLKMLVSINSMDNSYFSETKREAYSDALDLVNQLDVPEDSLQVSPVIPQIVADFLTGKEDYYISDLFNYNFLYDTNDRIAKWLYDNDKETNKKRELSLILAHYGEYTVEEEPQYRLKAGESYLYFNLDGTVRGVKENNATITKERLEQLPFDVEKAVESGIIEVEELEEEGKLGDPSQLEPGQLKMWTEEEEDYLAKHYPTTNASDIAKALGRSKSSVRSKAYSLGIK